MRAIGLKLYPKCQSLKKFPYLSVEHVVLPGPPKIRKNAKKMKKKNEKVIFLKERWFSFELNYDRTTINMFAF